MLRTDFVGTPNHRHRAGRETSYVHGEVKALLDAGVLQKTDAGKIVFPFDALHVDFMLKAA